jgi:hypothetical protein
LITRLTVFFDTPERRATSLIVGFCAFAIGLFCASRRAAIFRLAFACGKRQDDTGYRNGSSVIRPKLCSLGRARKIMFNGVVSGFDTGFRVLRGRVSPDLTGIGWG